MRRHDRPLSVTSSTYLYTCTELIFVLWYFQ